ncbi:hypothetical protein FSP39_002158 [Pinctada imbricata]|uniref:J domain-containing protein n=1 Tax=Pinctada imbricata TaxID=66713 RepID=A0AA88YU86_PINIB|nr:hypothetical protein FSP39_002158 [Pinctada imbricata]
MTDSLLRKEGGDFTLSIRREIASCRLRTMQFSKVKRGYHNLSLKVHPDRVSDNEKEEATKKFQTLGKVYSILSDKEKRAVYDNTGEIDEEDDVVEDRDWYDYWRLLFKKISVDDINNFEKDYKGSGEELEDLKSAYLEFEGSMDDILDNVMCASLQDEDRFTKIIKGWIKSKEVPNLPKFTQETKASKTARKRRVSNYVTEK